MKLTNLTIKDLFTDDAKLTFLVGAGCSVDTPSCLPAGRSMMEALINYTCAESERKNILQLEDLRFEQLIEIIRDRLDPDLKIIDYYGLCDKPNLHHFFLADMMKKGHFVMTTNFDFLIEYALEQSGFQKDNIMPVITKYDFERHSDPERIFKKGKQAIYKIHGSTKNIITGEDTRKFLVATIQAFGSGKEGENVFQVEPFKRPLFDNISHNRTLVVMGYSGSDDFDIIPTLKVLKNLKNIIWINYIQDDDGVEKIYEIEDSVFQEISDSDKVNQILNDIHRTHNAEHIYRVDANTMRLIKELLDSQPNLSSIHFTIKPIMWIEKNITPTNEFHEYFIPYKIYDDLNKIDDALKCLNLMLEIAEKKKNDEWKAICLSNIGGILEDRGELEEAINRYRGALAIAEQLGDLRGKAIDLINIGGILERRGELEEALNHYREALSIDEQIGDLRGKANGLSNIGYILEDRGELEEALNHYQEALSIDEQLGDLRGKAIRLSNIGLLLYGKGEFEEALNHYREALSIDEQLGNLSGKAIVLNNIGEILEDRGELEEALNHYRELLAIAEHLGDLRGKAIVLNNIGGILEDRGELEEALNHYQEALSIDEQLGDLRGKAIRLSNIGLLLYGKGELEEALNQYREALAIDEQLGNLKGKAIILNNIGKLLKDKGELEEALNHYREALSIKEQLGDLSGKVTLLNNIGYILEDTGELEEALNYYQKALVIAEQLGSPNAKIIKENIEYIKSKISK